MDLCNISLYIYKWYYNFQRFDHTRAILDLVAEHILSIQNSLYFKFT